MIKLNILIIINLIIKVLIILIPVLLGVAFLTLGERKLLGYSQNRKGPNIIGFQGLFQPLADGAKLFFKEFIVPNHVSMIIYLFSPTLALILGLIVWVILPLGQQKFILDNYLSLLLIIAIGSIGVYAILMSGWGSNSKYAFLGALRATAQMISYEVSLGLILMTVVILSCSFDFYQINLIQKIKWWFCLPLLPAAFMFLISGIAETNRAPFDLTEGESELVSGFNIEYPGMTFALFFLAEYAHIIFTGFIFIILFIGGWGLNYFGSIILCLKSSFIILSFVWIRTSFPRFRYDQLMHLIWKSFLPTIIFFIILLVILLFF